MEIPHQPLLDQRAVRRALNAASSTHAASSVLEREVADRLFERLQWLKLTPQVVLDVGARVGYTTNCLQKQYPGAQVFGVDVASRLLQQVDQSVVCAESCQLPFRDDAADLIFSNLDLHWSVDPLKTLQEYQRVLRPGGLLFFTTFGADTLKELYDSFSAVDHKAHVHPFGDMHDIGDLLLHEKWQDPVMDREMLTLHYGSLSRLFQDLKETGTQNALLDRPKHLMGKRAWQAMCEHYQAHYQQEGVFLASMELVYGHAWCVAPSPVLSSGDEVVVPLSAITKP